MSDNGSYPEFSRLASEDDEVFKLFRRHPSYTTVLEHVSDDIAKKYYKNIKDTYGLLDEQIFNFCEKLHYVGSPYLVKLFPNIPPISTTALRYLNTGLQIKSTIATDNIENVIEIGPGYGGQAVILNELLNIKNYSFVDLKEVNLLIEKFISHSNVDFIPKYYSLEDKFNEQYDLIISNFAFSELPRKLQNVAMKKILTKANNGFMIMNSHNFNKDYNFFTKEELLSRLSNAKFIDEIPNTSPRGKNYTVTFSK